jgi:hypothetical protein
LLVVVVVEAVVIPPDHRLQAGVLLEEVEALLQAGLNRLVVQAPLATMGA